MPVSLSSLGAKTMRRLTLTSGTSWTVPSGVTFINATLVGGGGGGGGANNQVTIEAGRGFGGQVISTNFNTTPGASISYSIGAGGNGGSATGQNPGAQGGSTTMTGATTAVGGNGGSYYKNSAGGVGTSTVSANNGGSGGYENGPGGAGGAGCIYIEYWV